MVYSKRKGNVDTRFKKGHKMHLLARRNKEKDELPEINEQQESTGTEKPGTNGQTRTPRRPTYKQELMSLLPRPNQKTTKKFTVISGDTEYHVFTVGNPLMCNVCKKVFKLQIKLNKHTWLHSGSKRYQCRYCEEQCKNGHDFNTHMLLHPEAKPYRCEICLKEYKTKVIYEKHVLTHEENSRSELIDQNMAEESVLKDQSILGESEQLHETRVIEDKPVRIRGEGNFLSVQIDENMTAESKERDETRAIDDITVLSREENNSRSVQNDGNMATESEQRDETRVIGDIHVLMHEDNSRSVQNDENIADESEQRGETRAFDDMHVLMYENNSGPAQNDENLVEEYALHGEIDLESCDPK